MTTGCQIIPDALNINPTPKAQGNQRRGGRQIVKPNEQGVCCMKISSRHNRKIVPTKSQQYGLPVSQARHTSDITSLADNMDGKF